MRACKDTSQAILSSHTGQQADAMQCAYLVVVCRPPAVGRRAGNAAAWLPIPAPRMPMSAPQPLAQELVTMTWM